MLCQCSINTDSTTQSQQRIIVIPTRECCLPRPQKDRLHFPEYMTSEMPSAFTWDCFCHFPRASQVALMVQNLSTNAGEIKDRDAVGLIPGSGRSPGEGNGNPLQYSCLKNPIGRGAWKTTVHGVAKSWTQLKCQHAHTQGCFYISVWIGPPSPISGVDHDLPEVSMEYLSSRRPSLTWSGGRTLPVFPWLPALPPSR